MQVDKCISRKKKLSHVLNISYCTFYLTQRTANAISVYQVYIFHSCLACVYRVMDARGKFREHERSVRAARGAAEGNSSFLSGLQTSTVHLYNSIYAQLKA